MSDTACDQPPTTRPPLTRADRSRMMAEAERGICSYVKRSGVPIRDMDDVMQDCRVAVWSVVDRFDSARGASWSTYVVSVVKRTILRHLSDLGRAGGVGGAGYPLQFAETDDGSAANAVPDREPDDEDDDDDEPDEDAPFVALGEAVRLKLAEPLLARLSGQAREIVEAIVIEGRSLDQVAVRVGRAVKDVKLIVRNAVRTIQKPAVKPSQAAASGRKPPGGSRSPGRSVFDEHAVRIDEARHAHPDWSYARLYRELRLPGSVVGFTAFLRRSGRVRNRRVPFAEHAALIDGATAAHPDWPPSRIHRELNFPGTAVAFTRYVRKRAAKAAGSGEVVALAAPPVIPPAVVAPPDPPPAAPTPPPAPARRPGTRPWSYRLLLVPGSAKLLLANAVRNRRR